MPVGPPNSPPEPELIRLAPGAEVPNNRSLPVVLVRRAVAPGTPADRICALMRDNGWRGTWVWSVFDFHHYHPDAHEALCVASGSADLMLGGAAGHKLRVAAGDLVVLPAGTGHCRLSSSPDFAICGAYPPGQEQYATTRANPRASQDEAEISAVPLPETDPVFGPGGPLIAAWSEPKKGT